MRKLLVALLAVALVLIGFFMSLAMPRHCPVNHEAFGRIKEGMTQAEVHAILGGPPGDYRTRPYEDNALGEYPPWPGRPKSYVYEDWHGDEGSVWVCYSRVTKAVDSAGFTEAEPHEAGPLDLVLWRLDKPRVKLLP
ncbi:MAG: hypothetical protein U0797_23825 [Gemmataceae bacterium]